MKKNKKRITFSDYDEEGLFAYKLSQKEGKNPYLICFLEQDEDSYRRYDLDTGEFEEDIWFHEDTSRLKEIARFDMQYFSYQLKYIIFKVTDEQAYLNIWSMASDNLGIA